MQCPVCKESDLLMTQRQLIKIAYCAQCRGVWLDRGELVKLMEKAQLEAASQTNINQKTADQQNMQNPYNQDGYFQQNYEQHTYYRKHDVNYYMHHFHYKRKSLFSEVFDF